MKAWLTWLFSTSAVRKLTGVLISLARACRGVINRAYLGYLWPDAGTSVYIHWTTRVKYPERITLGEGVLIGPNCTLGAMGNIELQDHVRLSEGVLVETGSLEIRANPPYTHIAKAICLEQGVWVGANAIILAGVTIGKNSVVGAGAVVSKSIPEDSVVIGCCNQHFPKEN